MSGHSKFANIKHKKEKNDAAKGKIFTIIGRELAVAVKEGGADPNNNSKLRDVIAKAKAAGFAQVRISDEDLVQEGMLGFLEAVKKFDPSKGVPFKAYASVCIKNRMINAFNRNNSAANSPLTGAVPIDDEQLTDHASNPENIIDEAAAPAKLWRIVDSALSVYERRVLDLMLEEKSYARIAELLGTSAKSVDNAVQRIRKKIRSKL